MPAPPRLPTLQGSERASSALALEQPVRPAAPGCDPPWMRLPNRASPSPPNVSGRRRCAAACSAPHGRSGNPTRPWVRPRRSRPRRPQARAMATRCCSPPDRSPGRLFPLPSRPTLFSTALVCAFVMGRPARRAGSDTFSPALSDGMRLYDWKMKPTWSRRVLDSALRPACTICAPIIWMEPESAASNPDRQYSSVDFPEPFRPMMPIF